MNSQTNALLMPVLYEVAHLMIFHNLLCYSNDLHLVDNEMGEKAISREQNVLILDSFDLNQ